MKHIERLVKVNMNKTYCLFSANYLPNLGGVERYTYYTAKGLIDKGNKVIVVTSNVDDLLDIEIQDGIKIIRVPCFKILDGRFPVVKKNALFKKLYRELNSIKIDYIIVNTRFYIHSYFGVRYAKKKNVPCLVIEHGTGHFTVNNKFLDFFGHIYEHCITNLVKLNCTSFYGVSEACNLWLKHFKIVPKGVLYNAVDLDSINKIMNDSNKLIDKKISFTEDDIIICYTGRLVKEKGILKLLSAFEKLSQKDGRLKLIVAGDGDLYEEIKKKESHSILILGKIPFEEVIAILKNVHIYCLPTDYPEGFPTSVLEAIACKCYIITTQSGGSKEIIRDKSYGTIMKKNSIDEIEKELFEAINNVEKRNLSIEKSHKLLCENFTWKCTVNNIISVLESGYGE